jgi:hypothetical protein
MMKRREVLIEVPAVPSTAPSTVENRRAARMRLLCGQTAEAPLVRHA